MTSIRLSLARPGAPAAELLSIARLAERYNLGLWLGDPSGKGTNSDDNYVMATAAAVSVATRDIRVGVWLSLRSAAPPIRIAEDIAVVDQMSGGRLSLGLVAPEMPDPQWRALIARVLDSWHRWPLDDGRVPAVTPPPAQPLLPTIVLGDPGLARELGHGIATMAGESIAGGDPRNIVVHGGGTGSTPVAEWLRDLDARLQELRQAAARAGDAREIVFVLDQPEVTEGDLKALGMVVAPGLRASAGDRNVLPLDAWKWMTEKEGLHAFRAG